LFAKYVGSWDLNFEKLIMSRAGTDLSEAVNEIMKKFRGYALHLLVSQFKRVADSITLNITDGSAGRSIAGFKKLLGNTLRSDTEVVGWLHLALL